MKEYLIKVVKFSIPLLLLVVVPVLFLFFSGENYRNIDEIIKKEDKYLIGYAYDEGNYRYLKHKELENRQSLSVIALGSSRMLQFRDKMFTKSFYNAGYTISSISEFIPFIEHNLLSNKPEVLLIGLDQWMFNVNWDDLAYYNTQKRLWQASFNKKASFITMINVWSDLFSKKYGLNVLFYKSDYYKPKIGLNAIVNNQGFRKDGSMLYGEQINKLLTKDSTAYDFKYCETNSRIDNGTMRFQYGNEINQKSISALNDLLLFCKQNNIYLVAILPPFANSVNFKMKQSGNYTYMDSIYDIAKKIFEQYGYELWDMSNLTKYNSDDNETIDGFHGSEVSYLKMLIYMVEGGSKLKEYTNIEKLKNQLNDRKNNYLVYPN